MWCPVPMRRVVHFADGTLSSLPAIYHCLRKEPSSAISRTSWVHAVPQRRQSPLRGQLVKTAKWRLEKRGLQREKEEQRWSDRQHAAADRSKLFCVNLNGSSCDRLNFIPIALLSNLFLSSHYRLSHLFTILERCCNIRVNYEKKL